MLMSKYFKNLNYTMANEDSSLEYKLLPENSNHVLSICGSGSRVLPLFAKKPKKVSLVDFSFEQIALTKLRIELVKQLDYESFLLFMGYKNSTAYDPKKRKNQFESLEIDKDSKTYLEHFFESHSWNAPLYFGNYEKAIKKVSKVVRFIMGKSIEQIKALKNKDEFDIYYKDNFPKIRWMVLTFLLGNSTFFNAILYKGNHPKKNIKESYFSYYSKMFSSLFKFSSPDQSFFLQFVLFGNIINLNGVPLEACQDIYLRMKEGIKNCEISFFQGDLIKIIEEELSEKIDFISFSDILSYFTDSQGRSYLQRIKEKLSPDALTVHRYYFHINKFLNYSGYKKVTEEYINEIHQEQTQIYIIDIYQRQ